MIESIWIVIENNVEQLKLSIVEFINEYAIVSLKSLLILISWLLISYFIYKFVIFLFKKFKILDLIDKFDIKFEWYDEEINNDADWSNIKNIAKKKTKLYDLVSKKIQIDKVIAKALSYYVFLLFFRWAIYTLEITEVEQFLKDILDYLPKLFIWIVIWYFGIRFANFVYDVIYHSLNLTKQKTAKIIASGAKFIMMFFVLMIVLEKVWIDSSIVNTIFIGFISMITFAWGLAFWLWWKDVAKEILENFRK